MSKRFIFASVLLLCKHAAADEQACTTSADCENVSHYCIDGTCRELPHAVPTEHYLALHVSGDAGGHLEYAELLSGPWTTLCVTPCTAYGRSKGVYRLTANGTRSNPLVLADRVYDVQLHATVGYRSDSELTLGITGASMAFTGGVMAIAGLLSQIQPIGDPSCVTNCPPPPPPPPSWGTPLAATGVVFVAIGLVLLIPGFVAFHSHQTILRQVSR